MNSIDYLDLLMSNQKKVKDGFKFINLKTNEQATIEDCYETIKKDLEVLEMLKKNINLNDCKQDEKEHKCIFMLILDEDKDYKVINEWLENAK